MSSRQFRSPGGLLIWWGGGLHKDEKFINLDKEDLFTNIPVSKAIEIVIKKIGCSEKFCESALTQTDLRQMLKISINNSYIQLNKKYYRQK